MSVMHIEADQGFKGFQHGNLENLVSTHFNRAFMVVNVFVDDARACLDITENVFRTVDVNGELSEKAVYGALVDRIRNLQEKNQFLEGVAEETVLCWLVKETSRLRYDDIAGLMGLEHNQVKLNIAGVRGLLLG